MRLFPNASSHKYFRQMVNLSPTVESYFETLCSLRFAAHVNTCELGKPKKNLRDADICGMQQPQSHLEPSPRTATVQKLQHKKSKVVR